MSFISFTTAELGIDKAIKSTTMYKIRNNVTWLREVFQYNLSQVPNRDFEFITNNQPDLWECTTYEGGYVGVSTSTSYSGRCALMIVHDGSSRSGGQAISDFIPITTLGADTTRTLNCHTWGDSSVSAGVECVFYDGLFTALSTSGGVSTGRTTVPDLKTLLMVVPSGARWFKVKVRTSTAAGATFAGTVYWDNFNWFSWG
jgi:hypothetical protein